ncbi:MAG: hypothetical protein KDD61_06940 [Bdellovibrionales bacterium]|nr:hypothetical protein [Bdellovibrionales bacterium]
MNSTKHLILIPILAFIGGFYSFYKVSYNSWDQQVFFYSTNHHRHPAAINKQFDFSHLEGSQLISHSQERLLAAAKILMNEESVGIELGHFVSKNANGSKEFACRAYDKVVLVFKAGDMLVHGEPPEMLVQGPCSYENSSDHINAIWIPMAKILKQKTGNISLDFHEVGNISISFSNIGDEWPRVWGLAAIQLKSTEIPGKEISIDENRMRDILEKPITFFWANDFDKELNSKNF